MPLVAAAPLSMGLLTHSLPPSWHPAPTELQNACQEAALICKAHNVDLPTLSIIFALSCFRKGGQDDDLNDLHRYSIPCTLIGMSRIEEVDYAVACAKRFATENDKSSRSVWTKEEEEVLSILQDQEKGPFAMIWKKNKHQWDGVEEANNFWKQVPGGKKAAEARMRE